MKILFFDGYCNLCNGTVDWLIHLDKKAVIKFASLQGESAKKTLPATLIAPSAGFDPETIVYFRDGQIYERSSAIIACLTDIGWPLSLFAKILLFVPLSLRDFAYRFIAKNRFKIFGRRSTCRIPSENERQRFLD